MHLTSAVLLALVMSPPASGQSYSISTLAGGGLPVNIPGTSASLGSQPQDVAADRTGNVCFVVQNVVVRLDAITGLLTLVAGNGTTGPSGDNGPATSAQLNTPRGLAFDSAGRLYIADSSNSRIRMVSNGVITTVAGNGTGAFGGDGGPAIDARLSQPFGIAVDSAGNLFIADLANNRIRKVSNGVITTVAGNGTPGFGGDNGPATSAELYNPSGVAVDSAGTLYIADSQNHRIRKILNGTITTVAGTGEQSFGGENSAATSAQLNQPYAVAVDLAGNLFIADTDNGRIRRVSNGVITTVAGGGFFLDDGVPATRVRLSLPYGVVVDYAGSLYIADSQNYRIRKVSNGVITTVAGDGTPGFRGDNGPAAKAQFSRLLGVAMDRAGSVYVADSLNHRVRKIAGGVVTTVAGSGQAGFSGDNGPATSAQLNLPSGVAVDSAGSLYIADSLNRRIRKVSNGVITTVAGNGISDVLGDNGPATSAQLAYPNGVAVDSAGALYIADSGNYRIRKVSNGLIATMAGNGTPGYGGDNGPAASAQLGDSDEVAVDSAGNLYIADAANHRIRKVSSGVITTVAGNGATPVFLGPIGDNGPATASPLYYPGGISVDSAGNLYIAESNGFIRKVSNGVITTIAGNGGFGFSGEAVPATTAWMDSPLKIIVASSGSVYIADGSRIRVLTPVPTISPGGIANAASFAFGLPVAPGSIATAFGNFLITSLVTAPGAPLPNNLAGLSMQFGSGPGAPLFAVSPGQVNFQVPWELADQSQTSLFVTANGNTGPGQAMFLAPFAPGIFSMNAPGSSQGAIVDADYRLVDSSNPATAGSTVVQIFCTGLGAVGNQPPTGSPALNNPLSFTTAAPAVTIGGAQAVVLYSGLAPGSVGEYQVNALVPAASAKGSAIQVVIAIGGATSNSVTIAVQ